MRNKILMQKILVVFFFNLVFFPATCFWESYNIVLFSVRMMACMFIGLWFAWSNKTHPIQKQVGILISILALAFAFYYMFVNPALSNHLYDLVWYGIYENEPPLAHPIRLFIGYTLFDQYIVLSHMTLVAASFLGQIYFSRKFTSPQSY